MSQHLLNRDVDRIAAALAYILSEAGIPVDRFAAKLTQHTPTTSTVVNSIDGRGLTVENCEFYSDMIALWRRGHEFVNEEGEPKPLPVDGREGSVRSLFDQAMQQNKAAQTTLEETLDALVQHGTVTLDQNAQIHLNTISFFHNTAGAGLAMQLNRLAVYSETVAHNTSHRGGRFDRAATVSSFPSQAIPLVNAFLEESGMQFLEEVDDFLGKTVSRMADTSPSHELHDSAQRVTVGLFFSESDSLNET